MNKENDLRQKGIAYFKQNKDFQRFFSALRKKWKKYGRSAGIIKLTATSAAERETLGKFFGKSFFDADIRIPVADFEKALKETKFSDLTVRELIEGYYGEPLEKNTDVRRREQEKWQSYCNNLSKNKVSEVGDWLQCAWDSHQHGYMLMKNLYETVPEELEKIIKTINGVVMLRHDNRRLAIISAELSGNPHYFDFDRPAGKLLVSCLSCIVGQDEPRSAEARLELYYKNGFYPDDMSSFTFLFGIHLYGSMGLHPAYEGFITWQEPYVVTLSNLKNIYRAMCDLKCVYVVENQTVFSYLCAFAAKSNVALMCTSGQVRTASLIVFDLLVEQNYHIFYSGDLDPEGILIADRLINRHPRHIEPWHMTPEDYRKSLSQEPITEARLKQLDNIRNVELKKLIPLLKMNKKAGYQEILLEELKKDVGKS